MIAGGQATRKDWALSFPRVGVDARPYKGYAPTVAWRLELP